MSSTVCAAERVAMDTLIFKWRKGAMNTSGSIICNKLCLRKKLRCIAVSRKSAVKCLNVKKCVIESIIAKVRYVCYIALFRFCFVREFFSNALCMRHFSTLETFIALLILAISCSILAFSLSID